MNRKNKTFEHEQKKKHPQRHCCICLRPIIGQEYEAGPFYPGMVACEYCYNHAVAPVNDIAFRIFHFAWEHRPELSWQEGGSDENTH